MENFGHRPNSHSPQKGSGQDRFRQMLAGVSGYAENPATASLKSVPTNILHHQQGYFHAAAVPIYDPLFPGFSPGMYSESSPVDHRVAVGPITYPATTAASAAANLPRPMSQVLMPLPNGAANHDKGGREWVHDRYSGGKGARAPVHTAGTLTQPWTSILSSECQKRRFNPQFDEWINPDGTYQCTVDLNGRVLNDSRCWSSALDAKQALSRRAVDYIRKLPLPDGSYYKPEDKPKIRGTSFRPKEKSYKPLSEEEDERRLLRRIQSLYGHSGGPSEGVMADPAASHAFLEGFALGCKLRETSRDQRRRSRSPFREGRQSQRGSYNGFIKRE
ncbi:hypothetical protein TruAng_010310 [Truncatella angustata]|nr:hypothetical protein TruAng_010310 [Truncatella angustata]